MVRNVGFKSQEKVESALKKIFRNVKVIGVEEVSVYNSAGRVLAEDIVANFDLPTLDRSAMDGYAVKAEETFGASETNPIMLKIIGEVRVGELPSVEVESGSAVKVFTGSVLPKGANAVVMLEFTKSFGDFVEIFRSVTPFKNVLRAGEDVRKGEVVLKRGEIIQPQDAGILASLGFEKLKVYKKPVVAVISTGNELVEIWKKLEGAKIYNSNNPMLCNAILSLGFSAKSLGITRDDPREIENKLLEALSFDMLIFTGGTSVGAHDYVPEVVSKHGEILFHGVAMKPGMPTAFGIVRDKPVFMLPGSPSACLLAFETFVVPALYRMMNVRIVERKGALKKGVLQSRIPSELGVRSYVRVYWDNGKVYPVRISGSGILSSLVKANALLIIPENLEGYEAGEEVEVMLIRDLTEVFE
ncbi:MAG: molybdopterin molybdotransferase MoeA [Archaeoglobaceae archaeon]|nr:molybdopterin molybdotransferase MoeA [Archaeoglobaceae archaeon]MDW8127715.1 molybdopterin molybdotransferase MoeA [Archaeoglobaceae archaeon]